MLRVVAAFLFMKTTEDKLAQIAGLSKKGTSVNERLRMIGWITLHKDEFDLGVDHDAAFETYLSEFADELL